MMNVLQRVEQVDARLRLCILRPALLLCHTSKSDADPKKETWKGFLHLYSDFDMPQDVRGYTANIEVMMHQESGLPATAYVLSVGVQAKMPIVLGRAAKTDISIPPASAGSVARGGEDVNTKNGGASMRVEVGGVEERLGTVLEGQLG